LANVEAMATNANKTNDTRFTRRILPLSLSTRQRQTDMSGKMHVYEVRPRRDKRGFDLISDVLPFGRL
jgi:hypothetical protein